MSRFKSRARPRPKATLNNPTNAPLISCAIGKWPTKKLPTVTIPPNKINSQMNRLYIWVATVSNWDFVVVFVCDIFSSIALA